MIHENLTLEKYGYSTVGLSSNKKIIVICDYCGSVYESTLKRHKHSTIIVDKDACKNCNMKKHKDVMLAKYSVNNPSKISEVQKKKEETSMLKYSSSHYSKTQEYKDRIKNTVNERYGVDNVFQLEDVKQKIIETNLKKYGVKHLLQKDGIWQERLPKQIATKIERGQITLYEERLLSDIAEEKGYSSSRFYTLVKQYGYDKAITMEPYQSSIEQIIENFLDEKSIVFKKNIRVKTNDSFIIPDFYLPEYNLVIETDGIYWHSDAVEKDKKYHSYKRQTYIDNGYVPLFFREDEINTKLDIIKSVILNKCNMSQRIFGRKTRVSKLINKEVSRKFIEDNHLMGAGVGDVYGLIYEDNIVSIIQVKRINKKNYEISRFCNKMGYTVIGAFSKLLKYIKNNIDMESLTTFIDLRYGQGSYLSDFGFEHIGTNLSFKWTDGYKTFHRMQYPGNSGYEHKLAKIWDCGQAKHLLRF